MRPLLVSAVLAATLASLWACSSPSATATPPAAQTDAASPCGTAGAAKCGLGESCSSDAVCATSNCVAQRCGNASCTNGKRDGDEVGKDCGGSCSQRCDGAACTQGSECQSRACANGVCAPNGTKSCGVGAAALCANGAECSQPLDCSSDVCSLNGLCVAPGPDVHGDAQRNAGETGVDCGGAALPEKVCTAGQACKQNDDCEGVCDSGTRLCLAPSSTDGKRNQGETATDCGGANAPSCDVGLSCLSDADCARRYCTSTKVCGTPTSSDGVRNGHESDVDCGGVGVSITGFSYAAPRCAIERGCSADSDCGEGKCSPKGKCLPPSCATQETGGIDTCGVGEPSLAVPYTPAATHETCCRSLKLPTVNKRLDKYEITAGRYRSFINAVAPDVRGWATRYAAAHPSAQLTTLLRDFPTMGQVLPATYDGSAGLRSHLAIDMDNYSGGIRGCYNGAGSSGGNTYSPDDATRAAFGLPARVHAREIIDAKSLTCQTPAMLMAFCAWDGGELATLADIHDAWGADAYPWGPTDTHDGITGSFLDGPFVGSNGASYSFLRPTGAYLYCNGNPPVGGPSAYPARTGTGGWACQNANLGNNGVFYAFPQVYNTIDDQTPWVGAPGRFIYDRTRRVSPSGGEAWADLYATLGEYTGDLNATGGYYSDGHEFCDFSAAPAPGATTCTRPGKTGVGTLYTGIPTVGIYGVSWEGHIYGRGATNSFPAMFQYGKFGGRCVRPVP